MANELKLILLMILVASSCHSTATARALNEGSRSTLVARLKLEDESLNCWDSLLELKSCTGEIILFFLNGETYLGPGCCRAIRIITEQCWPGMIGTLGFTEEEGGLLEGYCDSTDSSSSSSASSKSSMMQIASSPQKQSSFHG